MPIADGPQVHEETLPAIDVPATWLHGGRSRFVNIYAPEIERIRLPACTVGPHPLRLECATGDTWTHLHQHRLRVGRFSGPRTQWRYWSDASGLRPRAWISAAAWSTTRAGSTTATSRMCCSTMRQRWASSARDSVPVRATSSPSSRRTAPPLTRQLLNLLGYETLETHRAVRARLVTLQQLKDVPYHLLPFAATLQPTVLPADHHRTSCSFRGAAPAAWSTRTRSAKSPRPMATPRSTWKTCRCWNRSR